MDTTPKKEVTLEATNQHTPQEMIQAWIEALTVAAQMGIISGTTAAQVFELFRELIHWAFMKDGEHSKPAELLMLAQEMRNDPSSLPPIGGDKKQHFDA